VVVVEDERAVRKLLGALDDEGCRAILEATSGEALSASEVAERCGLALSTAYRKLEQLAEAGLLEERTRIRPAGKHPSEYIRAVASVTVGLDDGGRLRLATTPYARTVPPWPPVRDR
jgi:DNA-binding transcriptional ArsR family regulator